MNVSNINENPIIIGLDETLSIEENLLEIAQVQASDPEGDTIYFSISGIVTISLHTIPRLFSSVHIKCEFVSKVFPDKISFPIIIMPKVFLFDFIFFFY